MLKSSNPALQRAPRSAERAVNARYRGVQRMLPALIPELRAQKPLQQVQNLPQYQAFHHVPLPWKSWYLPSTLTHQLWYQLKKLCLTWEMCFPPSAP